MICRLCPRNCGAERTETLSGGVCAMPSAPVAARAMLHQWEEPCLTGERGAGTVFFSGCNLRCVFCQNAPISQGGAGKILTAVRLREIFHELIAQGAACIDLVTPTHFTPAILEALGAGVFDALKIQAEDLPLDFDLDRLRAGGCWAVFTSGGGTDSFFRRLDEKGMDLRALHSCKFAAIGPATAARLRAHGIRADLCPAEYTSQGLGEALLQRGEPGEDMFLFRSRQGSPVLPKLLAGHFHVEDIPLYEVRPGPAGGRDQLERADYLAFASAGGVERFLETYGAVPEGVVPVCIGPVTARALEEASGRPYLIAPSISAAGIVQAIQAAHLDL